MKLTNIFEYETAVDDATKDGLFLERLETFMEKCLADIKAFSERELRPFEETRRFIAQWHAKYLFQPSVSSLPVSTVANTERSSQVRNILCDTSRILESLTATCGVESFLLAVDPHDISDSGFLGGSLLGREFWRGLRGGGEHGAKAFKTHCVARLNSTAPTTPVPAQGTERQVPTPPPRIGHAKSLKSELYEVVRRSLRHCSGVRNAEMKWTNPEKLDIYGVRLIGWPEGIPSQNPSMLKVGQNKTLLEAIQNGSMRFERINTLTPNSYPEGSSINTAQINCGEDEDFSWAYDANAHLPSPLSVLPTTMTPQNEFSAPGPSSFAYSYPTESTDEDFGLENPTLNPSFSPSYTMEYTSPDGHDEQNADMLDTDWIDTFVSDLEPPRKRLRSVEPSPESGDSSNGSDSS